MRIRLLDRYIAWQVFMTVSIAVLVLMILFILGNVYQQILKELADRPGIGIDFILKFIMLIIPSTLPFTIPFAFLFAILLTFGRLSADNEFIAIRMAGQSMWRICLPVGMLSLLFTGICGWVSLSIAPWAKTELEGMKDSIINRAQKDPMLLFPNQKVMTVLPGHFMFAKKEGDTLTGFQMVKMDGNEAQVLAIANRADVSVELESDDPELVLDMKEVNLMVRGQKGDFIDSSQPIFMEEAVAGVSMSDFKEDSDEVGDQPENISFRRLLGKVVDSEIEADLRTVYRTELSMRFAFSVSCLSFALIGVPLGITAQRRESTSGFILSMIIAVTYYTVLNTILIQKENEGVYPHLLVWIPNILLVGLGGFMFWRLSRK